MSNTHEFIATDLNLGVTVIVEIDKLEFMGRIYTLDPTEETLVVIDQEDNAFSVDFGQIVEIL